MSYPVPTPTDLADQISSQIEAALAIAPDGTPRAVDARSPRSVLAALARANAGALYSTHLHLRRIADELMPDTAQDYLARHATIWGVPQRAATKAVGTVIFAGAPFSDVPSGVLLALNGAQWQTTAAAVLDANGLATVPVTAVTAGVSGNVVAGVKLPLVSPVVTLTAQQAIVAMGCISGGADVESIESWRARLLATIREPAHGGAAVDYEYWAQQVFAVARINVVRNWVGLGSVGVIFLMPDAAAGVRVPTSAEILALDTYLQDQAPVTAEVVTLGGTLVPVNVTLQVNPNSAAAIAAAQAAIEAWFKSSEFGLGTPLRLSRLSEAISAATGETFHRITSPAADVIPAAQQMITLGSLSVTGVSS